MEKRTSLFNWHISPFLQMGVALGIAMVILIVIKIGISASFLNNNPTVYWEGAFSVLLLYMVFNAGWSFAYNKKFYFLYSIMCYVIIAVVTGYLAQLFSGISMDEAGYFRWMYVVFTIGYLIFLGIVNAMRVILELVKKQDAALRGE